MAAPPAASPAPLPGTAPPGTGGAGRAQAGLGGPAASQRPRGGHSGPAGRLSAHVLLFVYVPLPAAGGGSRSVAAARRAPQRGRPAAVRGVRSSTAAMLALGCSAESGSVSDLFEAGTGVNAPADASGQSPAHLAACGGEAFFLLWQLQTGANLNQQDCLGEAPIHKAAKVGSLECLALLVAGDAKIDLCNNSGQTAADIALAYGFLECAKFLTTIEHTQTMKLRGQSGYSLSDKRGLLRAEPAAQEQSGRCISRKRRRSDDLVS